MITDYRIFPISHSEIDYVIIWNKRLWLSHKQLQQLLHVSKGKLERLLSKLALQMNLSSHQEIFSIVKLRRQADGECEYIYQIRHYDDTIIRQLVHLCSGTDPDLLLTAMDKLKAEAMQ